MSGLRAEEFGDLIFLDRGPAKIEHNTFEFFIVLDGAASHLTAYPCKSTSPSEVISKLHEWMNISEMNPKAIFCTCGFPPPSRHAGILPNAQREENSNRTTYTMAEPSRDGCTTVQEFFLALVDTASKILDQTTLAQITPAQTNAQGGDSEKYPDNLE